MYEQKGHIIALNWDHRSEVEYVRGHVEPGAAVDEASSYFDEDFVFVEHDWARWVPTHHTDLGHMIFYPCDKGPGAFAVSVVRRNTND